MAVSPAGAVNATATQSATSSSGFKLFGGKGISFMDVLKVVGGGLLGGPIGAALSFAGVVAEKAFSKDGGDTPAGTDAGATQTASTATPDALSTQNPVADAGPRPGGWMINMAYGARDPYSQMGGTATPANAPGTAVASTAINDPRLGLTARTTAERPGGWMINAAYGIQAGSRPINVPGTAIAARI
jgi:hypothetical protein